MQITNIFRSMQSGKTNSRTTADIVSTRQVAIFFPQWFDFQINLFLFFFQIRISCWRRWRSRHHSHSRHHSYWQINCGIGTSFQRVRNQILFLVTFSTSVFSAALGMTKYLQHGPCRLIPKGKYLGAFPILFLSFTFWRT